MPRYIKDALGLSKSLSLLRKAVFEGIRGYAEAHNIEIKALPADPNAQPPPEQGPAHHL